MKTACLFSSVLLVIILPGDSTLPSTCKDAIPYELVIDNDDETKYYVCFDKIGKPLDLTCPEFCVFNTNTKSCAPKIGSGDGSFPPACTANNEDKKIDDPAKNNDDSCVAYQDCIKDSNNVYKWDPKTCDANENFDFIKNACVSADQWYCGKDGPDCDLAQYQDRRMFDKYDCRGFYTCIGNVRVKGVCPVGQAFDAAHGWCSATVICTIPSAPSPTNPTIKDICKGKSLKFVADPNYCLGYYYCIDDKTPYWSTCPDGKKYFNDGACTSTRPNTCKCEDINWNGSPAKVLVQHSDKDKFYVCQQGKAPEVRTCPQGTYFNVDIKSCSY